MFHSIPTQEEKRHELKLSYPFIGPSDQIENASGLHCSVTISATDPGALLIRAAPAQALRIVSVTTSRLVDIVITLRNEQPKSPPKTLPKHMAKP